MNVIYARKSSESEERQVLSIPAQVGELRALAERNGHSIDRVLEESRSAREPGRPVFGDLLRAVERGEIDHLYVWRLDRLARNPVDGGVLIHHLGHRRLRSITTAEGGFVGSGNDKLLMQIQFGMATKYVDDLSENVRRGNRQVLASGRITGRPPIGYLKGPTVGRVPGRGAGLTIIDPERFPLIQRLWRMMLTGAFTLGNLRVEGERMGLRTRANRRFPGMPLTVSGLSSMFRNPFYCGQVVATDGNLPGGHDPVVTQAEFRRVQEILGRRKGRGKRWFRTFTYSGLLRCSACGRGMTGEEHVNRQGHVYVYYRCARKTGYARCTAPYVSEPTITAAVVERFHALALPADIAALVREYVEHWAEREASTLDGERRSRATALARKEAALRNLTRLAIQGDITDDEFRLERATLTQEIEGLKEPSSGRVERIREWRASVEEALALAPTLSQDLMAGPLPDRRLLLAAAITAIVVTDRQPTVELRPELTFVLEVAAAHDRKAPSRPPDPPGLEPRDMRLN